MKLLPSHCCRFPAEEVESKNVAAEVDPRRAGLSRDDVDAIWTSVKWLYGCPLGARSVGWSGCASTTAPTMAMSSAIETASVLGTIDPCA